VLAEQDAMDAQDINNAAAALEDEKEAALLEAELAVVAREKAAAAAAADVAARQRALLRSGKDYYDWTALPKTPPTLELHPAYKMLLKEYPYQKVVNQDGVWVNIMLVRDPPLRRRRPLCTHAHAYVQTTVECRCFRKVAPTPSPIHRHCTTLMRQLCVGFC
jgi:hypothetical protein